MRRLSIALLSIVCVLLCLGHSSWVSAQHGNKPVDWKKELQKAQNHIERNPKSSFWHNQAGIAYDALGDAQNAERELTLAAKLDSTNPIGYYALYAFYQRKGTLAQQRQVLLTALDNDSLNSLGHFELGSVLEKEGYLTASLKEYRTAKSLVSEVKGEEYVDGRGNPYEIEVVKTEVDKCIDRVAKLIASKGRKE
jgi:tetratricopeptide (TPR) repeat protein